MIKSLSRGIRLHLAILSVTGGAASVSAQTLPILLQSVQYNGPGCPAGSAVVEVASDAQAFTILFDAFTVEAGGVVPRSQERKTCNLDLVFQVSPGWTFTVDSLDFRGYAQIERNAVGQQISSVMYPPRMALTKLAALDLEGPSEGDYLHHVEVPASSRIMAPCVGTMRRLQLRTNIGVMTQHNARALLTMDSVDGVLEHRYRLHWLQCPGW